MITVIVFSNKAIDEGFMKNPCTDLLYASMMTCWLEAVVKN